MTQGRDRSGVAQRQRRLLGIVAALAERPQRRRALAERFGVSERQITDDLTTLRQAGIGVSRTPAGYALAWDVLPPIPFTSEPLVSVRGRLVRLVRLVPRGTVSWVEELIEPQPPESLLRAAVPDRAPRGLYPLTPALRRWLRERAAGRQPSAAART